MQGKLKKYVTIMSVTSLAVFVIYLFLFANLGSIVGVLGKTSIGIYTLAFVGVIFAAIFDSLAWHQILSKLSVKTKFSRIFGLTWVGTFIDAIVPGGWSGDVFKAYLLSKDKGVDGSKTAASIVVKKVFELLVTLGTLGVGLALLVLNYSLDNEVVIVIGVMMVLLSLPLVLIVYLSASAKTSKVVFKLVRRFSTLIKGKKADTPELENKLKKQIGEFHDGIMMLKTNPKSMFQPLIYEAISWLFGIITLFLIFASIGYIISPDKIIIVNSIIVNIQTQGVALAGFLPILSTALYRMLGTASLVSVASSLLATFPTFWFKVIVSFAAFQAIVFNRGIPFMQPNSEALNVESNEGFLGLNEKPKTLQSNSVALNPEKQLV